MNEFFRTPRVAFFLVALIFLGFAAPSPAAALVGGYSFSARMAQHLILQLVVPPLVLLSLPASALAALESRRAWRPVGWMLKQPLLTWLLGLGAMWAWHAPALCNAALRDPMLHEFQSLSLLLLGAAFWWPIVGPGALQRLPPLLGIVYLFTACLGCTVLGIIMTFAPPGLYFVSALPGAFNDWQFASPEDQRMGGLLMWVPGCLIYVCGILGLLARWYGAPEPETFPASAPERIS
jgi:cytochrome c oxidase assembly factor CtaG